jgi:hypothetical protein
MSWYALHATIFNPSQDFIHENVTYNWPWLKTDLWKKKSHFFKCLSICIIDSNGNWKFSSYFLNNGISKCHQFNIIHGTRIYVPMLLPILFASKTRDMNFCMIIRVLFA